MNDNIWLKEGFDELKQLIKEVNVNINEIKMDAIKQRNDIDIAHDKIRDIESDISDLKKCSAEVKSGLDIQKKRWYTDSLNEARSGLIKGCMIFLMIFLPMSCSNIKNSLHQTVGIMSNIPMKEITKDTTSSK